MKRLFVLGALALAFATAQPAQAANEWGLPDEVVARFDAKVVDVLCELTGDCPEACGGGARQLGLLADQGALILPLKNVTPFTGASWELIDFCGKRVTADGLFSTNRGYRVFVLQFVREAPDGKWRGANRFKPKWAKRYGFDPAGKEAKQWFRHDPTVGALIERDGVFGLGLDADEAYFEANQ